MRKRNYKNYPELSSWIKLEDRRKRFVRWIDEAVGIEGNWLRDTQLGLLLRVEMYIQFLIDVRGWGLKEAEEEYFRLQKYVAKFEGSAHEE